MNHLVRTWIGMAAVTVMAIAGGRAWSQEAAAPRSPAAKPPAAAPKAAASNAATPRGAAPKPAAAKDTATQTPASNTTVAPLSTPTVPYRKLAPGVLETVPPVRQLEETVTRHDVTELIAVDAKFNWAQDVPFRHNVWMLNFEFKPVRMIWVDVPGNEGRMQRKLIWYMVYSVTNPGKVMHPIEDADKTYTVEAIDTPVRFIPLFSIEAHNRLQDETDGFTKVYNDKYIPVALGAIRAREDRYRQFRSTVEMPRTEIAVGETVWGIATWEDIDPRIVWFSVYVEGLTNAYRWKDDAAKFAADGKGYRSMFRKVLKLNFWRPGDEYSLKENQIRLGVPGQHEYEWVWRRVL